MKYIPISELDEITSASDTDLIAIDNGSKTSKITVANYNSNANATAKSYAEASATSASEAATSVENATKQAESAQASASAASESATAASASKDSASEYATNAATQADNAKSYASEASTSANNASTSATNANDYAITSKSWAVGGTSTRDGEDTNNAKYWSQVAAGAAAGGVVTFNGRNGAVVPQSGDYSASLISRGTSDVGTDLTKIETDLSSEVSRAKSAESSNTSAIANEVTRAKAAEESNANAITVETTRAKAAEEDAIALIRAGGTLTAREKDYIVASGLNTLAIKAGTVFTAGSTIAITEAATITVTGAAVGEDWLIYGYISADGKPAYKLSKLELSGAYFLLGGFHYGRIRNSTTATDVSEGIVPNSVWTQLHRPKCNPTGMAYVGNGLWADIYIMSGDPVASKYGAAPRVNITWYDTWNLLRAVGKRMPSYGEWCTMMEGAPEGQDGNNTYARSATSNTSAGVTGDVKLAVSSLNIVDGVGRVWEWTDELCLDPTANAWAWQDIKEIAGHGDMYIPSATALHALICGGDWNIGVHCGSRTVHAGSYPWDSGANSGGRGVCDSL